MVRCDDLQLVFDKYDVMSELDAGHHFVPLSSGLPLFVFILV